MSYGQFKSIEEVAVKFDISVSNRTAFVTEKSLPVLDIWLTTLEKKLKDDTSYINKFAICESIIRPILDIVAESYKLKVWSHVPYNVDSQQGLVGEPDYLIARKTKYGTMEQPVLCVIEAKKDNFDNGWTQALAGMVASKLLGAQTCYAIVTSGAIWQFGKLEQDVFVIDPRYLSATTELQRVFNSINGLFQAIPE